MVADFPAGAGMGFAVLSDGMGGHAAGDVASKIVVTEIFSELKMQSGNPKGLEEDISGILQAAVQSANDCVRYHAETNPETMGMGATLIALVFVPAAHSLLARRACAQATPEASNAICSALNAA